MRLHNIAGRFHSGVLAALTIGGIALLSSGAHSQELQEISRAGEKAILAKPGLEMTGARNPDLTIVEYFDYNCPFCRQVVPTFKRLLASTTDTKQRKAMLAAKVEDMINTVVRQIAFYTFERNVHTERRRGELTADRLNALWLEVQHESLGPAIECKPGYETYWSYIPHFVHSPFYVYAYAFGDCLVNSLYAVYERANEGFAQRYLDMLAAGGTKHHSELLAPFGLDARDPAFWEGGLAVIERMITELEALD